MTEPERRIARQRISEARRARVEACNVRDCPRCGTEFERSLSTPRKRYCSENCRKRDHAPSAARRERVNAYKRRRRALA